MSNDNYSYSTPSTPRPNCPHSSSLAPLSVMASIPVCKEKDPLDITEEDVTTFGQYHSDERSLQITVIGPMVESMFSNIGSDPSSIQSSCDRPPLRKTWDSSDEREDESSHHTQHNSVEGYYGSKFAIRLNIESDDGCRLIREALQSLKSGVQDSGAVERDGRHSS
ncbi:hypothetical protein TREMEDRAFT_58269 [Tremella mesenterica DSM 1558]|uniref:uncharacterized protein n=1 Tax=Tremella mesenterica (strain ATCC 24925 / CBS 8224 / DSM 1558 / NBRC 9311 / NRRL Y-6157 / RJB 2259-6 / UBC 559-6) TaxID=578456 RepID=UPI0003F494D9|nr:uncharacterized protein TREMEDRAFT_58269 [Tremella mesenterica DSM 1558]EIW72115.1 hypothetical protein TREMEDRAFT_58269 [Tremella mesenterica DSM 1558]